MAMTKYTTTCAGSRRERFSRRPVSASTSSTRSRGTSRVSTPIPIRSVRRPPGVTCPSSPSSATAQNILGTCAETKLRGQLPAISTNARRVALWKCGRKSEPSLTKWHCNQDHDGVIPLAERLDREWIRWYQRLARVKGISARAEDLPEESSVRMDIPGYVAPDRIRALLDTARALFREAGAALEKPPRIAEAEHAVRLWWFEQGRWAFKKSGC